jgi:NADPH:quinone reductase-like Zn-dependent oxidoreductase
MDSFPGRRIVEIMKTASIAAALLMSAMTSVSLAAPSSTTRTVVLEKIDTGAYRWKITRASVPEVGDRQVLVRVRAVALNRLDLDELEPSSGADKSGRVPGYDAAGDVVAVGKQVKDFRPGMRVTSLYFENWVDGRFNAKVLERVRGWTIDGVLSDYVVFEETSLAPMPEGLSYEEAATLPTAGLTAWTAVTADRPLKADDIVLVQGTGGVATFALQFAANLGAHVIVTSSSDDKIRRAKSLGAREGINYRARPAWADAVLELTQKHGADLVVDIGGKDTLEQSLKSVADDGSISLVGGLTGYDGNLSSLGLIMKHARANGIFVGSRADYLRMSDFVVKQRVRPVIEKVYPLDQYEAALKHLASNNFVGKIVLKL